jgi:hypothetical protein
MEKMLSRVQGATTDATAKDFTNDITSDPLAQFAVVFAALIHDVDHPGVSNAQLIQENDEVAVRYRGKSPAENHSLSVAWDTLMKEDYQDLVMCICGGYKGSGPNRGTKSIKRELFRLRQLVENAVLATDVFDADLKNDRNARWARVFKGGQEDGTDAGDDEGSKPGHGDDVDHLKATIVLEHLIQASDVAHTMQHWVSQTRRFFRFCHVEQWRGSLDFFPCLCISHFVLLPPPFCTRLHIVPHAPRSTSTSSGTNGSSSR